MFADGMPLWVFGTGVVFATIAGMGVVMFLAYMTARYMEEEE